jgi:hypothetical protein
MHKGTKAQGIAYACPPSAFIKKWKAANLKERSTSQEHFIDLCRLLDEPTPAGVTDFFFSSR